MSTKQKCFTIAMLFLFASTICTISGRIVDKKNKRTETSEQAESALIEEKIESNTSRAQLEDALKIREQLVERLKRTAAEKDAQSDREMPLFEDALALRMEEKTGYPPSEADLDAELERMEMIHQQTQKLMFDMAKNGFESIMADEEQNEEWEDEVNTYIKQTIPEDAKSIVSVKNVSCTDRICRMSFEHDGEDDRETFIKDMAMYLGVGVNGSQIYTEKAEGNLGSLETNMYITKKGDPLILMDIREAILNAFNENPSINEGV